MSERKVNVNMTNWELYVYDEQYSLSGIANDHPLLGKNIYISRTSSLVSYTYEKEVLIYETQNIIYTCPLKYMSIEPYKNVVTKYKEELTNRSKKSDSSLDMIIEVAARISVIRELEKTKENCFNWSREDDFTIRDVEYYKNDFVTYVLSIQEKGQQEIIIANKTINMKLIESAKQYEDCVYIEVSNVNCGSKLAYHIGGHTGVVEPSVHSGMFQDSVLYTKYKDADDDSSLDFRYFPREFGENIMETYSWSENIARVVIKNDCRYKIKFNLVEIEVGETRIFTYKTYLQGLVSPDCQNVNSFLSL